MLKRWPWRKILLGVGWSLILFGLAPLLCVYWRSLVTHSPRPVSIPVALKRGEYSSPFFETESNEDYLIDIQWDSSGAEWKSLNLDWRIVDDRGALLEKGTYNYRLRGNTAALGHYHSTRRLRQKVIVRNLQDAQGLDLAHAKLEISLPERSLDAGYAAIGAYVLVLVVAGPGVLILLSIAIFRAIRSNAPAGRLIRRR